MNIASLQIVLFLSSRVSRPDRLIDYFNSQMEGVFDDIPNVLRIPENAPGEIPIVQMSSVNGQHHLNLSRERFDYAITFPWQSNTGAPYSGIDDSIKSVVLDFIEAIQKKYKTNRLGCLGSVFINEANGIQRISNRYFKDAEIKKSTELSIRLNRITKLRNYDINNVLSVSNVNIPAQQGLLSGVWVEFDVNNIPIDGRDLTGEDIASIWKHFTAVMSEESIGRVI